MKKEQSLREFFGEFGATLAKRFGEDEIRQIFSDRELLESELLELVAPVFQRRSVKPEIILVPDISATELTALTKKELQLTYLDSDQATWDFYVDANGKPISGRGKKFEVLTWKPGRPVSSEEVREHFRKLGFTGHAGAFTQWLRTKNPDGYHATIPEDNACWRSPDGRRYVPSCYFDGGDRGLRQDRVDDDWYDHWVFVAFREVS